MAITDNLNDLAAVNPFKGLPSAPTNNSLDAASSMLAGGPSLPTGVTSPVSGVSTLAGSSGPSTAFGANQAAEVGSGGGGLKSLNDFLNMSKVADPAATAGMKGDFAAIGGKFSELGASIKDNIAASDIVGKIQKPNIPALDSLAGTLAEQAKAAIPTIAGATSNLVQGIKGELSGLMNHLAPTIESMTGAGAGQFGLPKLSDIMGPITGQSPAFREAMADPTSPDNIALINDAVSKCNAFFATAGIDLTTPVANNLKSCMGFATNLHKLGADTGGHGTSNMLANMATDDAAGDAIKASLIEGQNNNALAEAGVAPPPTNEVSDYEKEYKLLNTEWYKYSDQYDLTYSIKTKLELNNKMIEVQQKMIDLDNQNGDTKQANIDTAQLAALQRISAKLQGYLDKGNKSMKGNTYYSWEIPYP